jgi:hypothetical protein
LQQVVHGLPSAASAAAGASAGNGAAADRAGNGATADAGDEEVVDAEFTRE